MFFVFMSIVVSVPSVTATDIRINPQQTLNVRVGGTFRVAVSITDVRDLFAYEFKLRYDPSILSVEGEVKGGFFDSTLFEQYIVDSGTLLFGSCINLNEAKSKSGSGTLATITFKVNSTGRSDLSLYDTMLLDSDGHQIRHSTFNGVFDNRENKTVTTTTSTTTTTVFPGTTTTTTLKPSNYPQWSNLRHEPSIVTPQTPASIFVGWVDDVGLKTVIISENSTGRWVDHIVHGG